jgi:hypothetical protein
MKMLQQMPNKEQIDSIFKAHTEMFIGMRERAAQFLMPDPPSSEEEKKSLDYQRRLAESLAALDVFMSFMNVSGAMIGSGNFSTITAIADLTFALNTNTFWIKNATYLVPILNMSINAFLDANDMAIREQEPIWDNLQYHNRNCWLELLPAIVFCLKGRLAMRKYSLEMKKTFEPFLR